MLADDVMNAQVVHGLSLGFTLIFFAPLLLVAAGFFVYSAFARGSVLRAARVLSILWLLACVPAALFILMGYAFNSSAMHPLLVIPLWTGIGLALLWLPVALRVIFRVRPV